MKIRYTIEITVEGADAKDAAHLIDQILDDGTFQDAFKERAGSDDVDVEVVGTHLKGMFFELPDEESENVE